MPRANEESTYLPSTRWTGFLGWGDHGRPDDDDPAEAFHEASKNLPSVSPASAPGAAALETDPQAQATITRPVKVHPHLPAVDLPAPEYGDPGLEGALRGRRSRRHFGTDPISPQQLSTLLHAAYGVTGEASGRHHVRSVPSGGALYPLEIYPVVRNVEGVTPGLYHYNPLRQSLEALRVEPTDEALSDIVIRLDGIPDLAATCGVFIFVVGVFWRTRFKYGLRGYRWVLIEAGHVGQNVVLASQALGLSAVPYGGIWDRRADEFLGVDGVNESVVYSLAAGSPASEEDGDSSFE